MGTLLLKGKPVSDSIRLSLEPRVQSLKEIGIVPKLAALLRTYTWDAGSSPTIIAANFGTIPMFFND